MHISRRTFARIAGSTAVASALPASLTSSPQPVVTAATEPIRLHFNENPYGPSPSARERLANLGDLVWQYPAGHPARLLAAISSNHGIPSDQVLLGNGSAEILQLAARAFLTPRRKLVVADPTYEALELYARGQGVPVVRIPLDAAWSHDLKAMQAESSDAGLVYVCNPNNPTGSLTPKAAVRKALESIPPSTTVIVDEAYHHYVGSTEYESVIGFVPDHANLIVVRTFSKVYGLAGLRMGYAISQPHNVRTLAALQARNNLNVAALVAAHASLADVEWVAQTKQKNAATRSRVTRELAARGLDIIPSEANFFMVDLGRPVEPVAQALRAAGVAAGRTFPPLTNHLRVSVGTDPQMDRFLRELGRIL